MIKQSEWRTEDGVFIGPWWLRWAFAALAVGAPVAWFCVIGSISFDGVALWAIFMAAVNLLRTSI